MDLQIYATIGDDSLKKTIFEADSDNLRQWPWIGCDIWDTAEQKSATPKRRGGWICLIPTILAGSGWQEGLGLAPRLKMHPCASPYRGTTTKMHPLHLTTIVKCTSLPAATLWYNCTPASSGTNIALYQVILPCSTSLAVENHFIQSPFPLQLCVCLVQNLSQEYMTTSPVFMTPATTVSQNMVAQPKKNHINE